MEQESRTLIIEFDGSETNRGVFLRKTRATVIAFIEEMMTLDALVHEITKNIFDHAHGRGTLKIERIDGAFQFEIGDEGQESHDFETCSKQSRLVGNGINGGTGLQMILGIAQSLHIELHIDTSKGFHYSGTYKPLTFR